MGNCPSDQPGCNPPPTASFSVPLPQIKTPIWDVNTYRLPIYGLTGSITNTNPALISTSAPAVSGAGCTITNYGNSDKCHPLQDRCPVCPSSSTNPSLIMNCNLTFTPGYSDPNSASWTIDGTSSCYGLDAKNSCPYGGVADILTRRGDLSNIPGIQDSNICYYTPSEYAVPNTILTTQMGVQGANLPQPFIDAMLKRYALQKFIQLWNTSIYSLVSETDIFHHTTDVTDINASDNFRLGVWEHSSSVLTNTSIGATGLQKMQNLAISIAQYPLFTRDSNGNLGLYFYILGAGDVANDVYTTPIKVVGSTTYPTGSDLTSQLQLFTTESPDNGVSATYQPILSDPRNQTIFAYPSSGSTTTPSDILTNPYYIFVDLNSYQVYNINTTNLTTIGQALKSNPSGDYYVVGRIFVCTFTKLSPVSAFMASAEFPDLLSNPNTGSGMCDRILSDTSMIPQFCYNARCGNNFDDVCKHQMMTYCDTTNSSSYLNSNIFPALFKSLQYSFLLTQYSEACDCYNSRLAPPITSPSLRSPAMCFTGACTASPQILNAFNLTQDVCAEFCPTVAGWLSSANANDRSVMAKYLDQGKYQELCGNQLSSPPSKFSMNPKVTITLLSITAIATMVVYILIRRRPTMDKIIGCGFALLSFGLLSIIVAIITKGVAICDYGKKQQVCVTPITSRISLPSWCCTPNALNCECVVQGQCPSNNNCIGGLCIPA